MANQVGVFANLNKMNKKKKTFLEEGQKCLSTLMKYTFVQTQEPTRDNRHLWMRKRVYSSG